MKAKEYDEIRTLVDLPSITSSRTVPAGSVGVIVDVPEEGAPEYYSADIGEDGNYEHVELAPDEFVVISPYENP